MKIAIAYKDGDIAEHFGHCGMFAIYDYPEGDLSMVSKKLVECGAEQGHQAMAELLREQRADVVICGNMGPEAKNLLLSWGIIPIAGYCGNADTAADMLMTGQLPILDGAGCGGGCGGCSGGCCGGEEDGAEGCGCGCGDEGGCC